ncbi:hypothetical protein ABZW18_00550 [Streptomyces sp. NPDC004647]|uniref:hypothetical protein n=1 Tax=Streptomyces sp. NPDC004647 TaxID=3154671 RepID=UPI0033BE2BE8
MTKSHEPSSTATLPGLRIQRTEGRAAHHTQAGRIAVPLTLLRGAEHVEDVVLVLTAEETAAFHLELGNVLYPPAEGEAS